MVRYGDTDVKCRFLLTYWAGDPSRVSLKAEFFWVFNGLVGRSNAAADIFEAFNVVSLGGDFETVSNARWMMTSTGARRAVGRCSMEDLVRNRISTGKKLDFIAVVAVAALGLA